MSWKRKFTLSFLLVMFYYMLIPSFPDKSSEEETVHCPDGYAYRVKEHEAVEGYYVRCEDFDIFMGLLAKSKIDEASKLLIGAQTPRVGMHKAKNRKPNRAPTNKVGD